MNKGQRIRKLREDMGISQTELASRIGVSKQNLYKYENSIITNIPSDKIEAIARACNVSPEYIMGWTDDKSCSIEDSREAPYILKKYNELNTMGQSKTDAYIDGLLENPNYRKDAEKHSKEDVRKYTNITFEDGTERIAAFGGIEENDDEPLIT